MVLKFSIRLIHIVIFSILMQNTMAQSSVAVTVKGLNNGDSAIVRIQTSQTAYFSKKIYGKASNADINYTFVSLRNGKWSLSVDVNGYLSPSSKVLDLNNSSLQVDITLTQSVNSNFTYQWEDDSSFVGHAQQSYINDAAIINVLGKSEKIPANFSALDLLNIYQFYLSNEASEWTPDEAYRLSQTINKFSFQKKGETEIVSVKAKWIITDLYIDNDIDIKTQNGVDIITISRAAFSYASPLVVTIDGLKGTFFSKRLYAAILYYYTNKGTDLTKINQISKDKFGLEFLEPSDLIQTLMGESKSNFQSFTVNEKLAILAMFEELPKALQYDKSLKYLIRRINGQTDPNESTAAAMAYIGKNLIEFMDKAFASDVFAIQRIILHEKAHFLWANNFDNKTKDDWALVGSWFLDPSSKSGWSTSNTTEFVSAYAHEKNPNEDMAESISYYIINPDALRSRSIRKFEFVRDRIMQGTRYISVIRPDLTFQVYNLYPNYNYPGKIIRTKVEVTGAPTENKIINIELELNVPDSSFQSATGGVGRLFSSAGTFFDIGFTPQNKLGSILKGSINLTKFAKSGYYSMGYILLYNALGDSRMENNSTYGMKVYVNNPLEDTTAPLYINKTLKLDSVTEGFIDRSGLKAFEACLIIYNNDSNSCKNIKESIYSMKAAHIQYDLIEKNKMSEPGMGMGWAKAYVNWPRNIVTGNNGQSMLDLRNDYGIISYPNDIKKVGGYIPVLEFMPAGYYTITGLSLMDIAGNERSVALDNDTSNKSIIIDYKTQRGFRDSVYIKTSYPDLYPPILNLNTIKIKATPTQPNNPNGETKFEIWASVKDTSAYAGKASGIGGIGFRLRDPQGHEYGYSFNNCTFCYGGHPSYDTILNSRSRDGVYREAYQAIILPVGSAPGLWGVSSIDVYDMAQNRKSYNFIEIVRFDVDTSTILRVDPFVEILGKKINKKNVDSVGVKIGCKKCDTRLYKLTMYSSMGGNSFIKEGLMTADTISVTNLSLKGVNDGILYATVQMLDSSKALIGTSTASYTKDVVAPKSAILQSNLSNFGKSNLDSLTVSMKVTELNGSYSATLTQNAVAKGSSILSSEGVIKNMSSMSTQNKASALGDSVVLTGILSDSSINLKNLPISQFQDGVIGLKIIFYDSVGNESDPVNKTFYKDTKDPVITIKKSSMNGFKGVFSIQANEFISNTLTKDKIKISAGTIDSLKQVSNQTYTIYLTKQCVDSISINLSEASMLDTVGNKNASVSINDIELVSILPAKPTVRDTSYCNNITADTLKANALSGYSLNWYGTNATGGNASNLGSKPNTSSVGNFSYYVSQISSTTGCESPRAKIGVTINPLPIGPIVRDTAYCNNASADTLRVTTSSGSSLLWYGTNATGGTSSTTAVKPSTATVGTANYYLSQIINTTGCEGPRSKITVITKPIPTAPTLTRDTANYLLSGASGTTWYKDGVALTDTTQKFKPSTPGSYTAKTTTNGCTSVLSAAYYYLVTDIINLSKDEYIKIAPNPFINQLNFDFIVKGYQRLNIEVYDIATGTKVASQSNLTAGSKITLGQLSGGTYIIRVFSNDQKIVQQFKVMKM